MPGGGKHLRVPECRREHHPGTNPPRRSHDLPHLIKLVDDPPCGVDKGRFHLVFHPINLGDGGAQEHRALRVGGQGVLLDEGAGAVVKRAHHKRGERMPGARGGAAANQTHIKRIGSVAEPIRQHPHRQHRVGPPAIIGRHQERKLGLKECFQVDEPRSVANRNEVFIVQVVGIEQIAHGRPGADGGIKLGLIGHARSGGQKLAPPMIPHVEGVRRFGRTHQPTNVSNNLVGGHGVGPVDELTIREFHAGNSLLPRMGIPQS